MANLVSQFLRKITRTKSEQEDGDIDFLKLSMSFELPKSVQMLTGSCLNGALFIVVGLAVKSIAGPAMLLSIVLGAAVAMLNNLTLAELCTSFQNTTSFYTIVYKNVGELCAFVIGWLRVLQSIFMISLVSCAAGENIHYLVKPFMNISWLPGHVSWAAVRVDDLIFILAFLVLLSLIVAAGLPYLATAYTITLFWTGFAVFLFMLVVIIYYAGSLNWSFPTHLEPFDFNGMVQGIAITTIFFTRLDKVVERAAYKAENSNNTTSASLAISLLIVLLYYLCSTLFLIILSPFDMLSEEVTLPKLFSLATFHNSKYILSAAAIIVFCLTVTESYFDAQKMLNLMAEDSLVCRNFASRSRAQSRNWKRVPALTVLVTSMSSIPLFIWLRLENLILGFCIASLLISILINSTAIAVQYKPLKDTNTEPNEDTCLPKWKYSKYTIIRLLLCFGYITHARCLSALGVSERTEATNQTSKLVNWLVVQYIISCIGLSVAMFHGVPVIGWKLWIVLGTLLLLVLSLFLTVRMILIQPRARESLFRSNFLSSFVPLLNIALFIILLVSIKLIVFAAVGVWLGLGKTLENHTSFFIRRFFIESHATF